MSGDDPDIDRLFRLPLDEFTQARNTLAAQAGPEGAAIRRLQKPPLAAWAVNQLFWKNRRVYESLIESAEALGRAHRAALTGRRADLRAASRAHDEAIDSALKETIAIATAEGHKVTDATRHAIAMTLRVLPSDDSPGRLTRTLQPGGFEMLGGITPAGRRATPAATKRPGEPDAPARGPAARELARVKDQAAGAARVLREAEQRARRDEFENARAAREAEKAQARIEEAQEALSAAERAQAAAERAREKAEARAKESAAALAASRDRADAARAALDALTSPSSRGR